MDISKVALPNGSIYDIKDIISRTAGTYFIVGTQTGATNVWTGSLPAGVTEYYEGLKIDYLLPMAGTNAAVTLNLGGLGAKPVYYQGNKVVTTHFKANSIIHLTYIIRDGINEGNGAWEVSSDVGNILYTTFDIDIATGILSATYPDEVGNTTFELNDGYLEVIIE